MNKIDLVKLNEIINEPKKNIIMFSTEWCGECKMNFKLIEDVEDQYPSITFSKIDVDEFKLWSDDENIEFSIQSVPTYFMYENGDLIKKHEGFLTPTQLEEFIK